MPSWDDYYISTLIVVGVCFGVGTLVVWLPAAFRATMSCLADSTHTLATLTKLMHELTTYYERLGRREGLPVEAAAVALRSALDNMQEELLGRTSQAPEG